MGNSMCGKFRNPGVDAVTVPFDEMNGKSKKTRSVSVLAVLFMLLVPVSAFAELPAPAWMPGFPLLAGPQVILMWGPVPGAEKYNVYLDGKLIVKDQAAFQATHPAPTGGGSHQFEVVAVDRGGKEGKRSSPGVVKIIVLESPKELTLLPGDRLVQMRWSPAPGAIIYDVYRREKGKSEYSQLGSVQDTRYTDSTLEPKKVYEYAVKSKDVTGKSSDFSQPAQVSLTETTLAAEQKKKRTFTLNPLPTKEVGHHLFDTTFPIDVAVGLKSEVVVGADVLLFSESGLDGPYRTLVGGQRGFRGVCFDRSGKKFYAVNMVSSEVFVFDAASGEVLATHKVPPIAKGELSYDKGKRLLEGNPQLYDVAVDAAGNFYVSDNRNYRLVKLGPDGRYLGTVAWEKGSETEDWLVFSPAFVAIDSKGRKYMSSIDSIAVFGPDDKRIGVIGGLGQDVGEFAKVKGLATDSKDRLYASDMQNGTIQVFEWNPEFRSFDPVLMLSNESKNGNPASAPAGMTLSPSGRTLYVIEALHKHLTALEIK